MRCPVCEAEMTDEGEGFFACPECGEQVYLLEGA